MVEKRRRSPILTVVPTHQAELTEIEWRRLRKTFTLADRVVFAVPETLDTSAFLDRLGPAAEFEFFPQHHFQTHESYNRWLLEPDFYKRFFDFEFILISQTDSFLIRDPNQLPRDYDYIGAPWDPGWDLGWDPIRRTLKHKGGLFRRQVRVGNGGLSLRRISAFTRITRRIPKFKTFTHEDAMIGYFGPLVGLQIAPPDIAGEIFVESSARHLPADSEIPPVFGFHDLAQFNSVLETRLLGG